MIRLRFPFRLFTSAHAATAPALAPNRDFSQKERDKAAKTGAALPDGSFPIKSEQDLKNAIRAIGRAKDPAAAKRHIISRAKSLGLSRLLPADWKSSANSRMATHAFALESNGEPPEWLTVIPAGTFSGKDGRGPYFNSDPEAVAESTNHLIATEMKAGLPVDFDHATDIGGPAPAAGWIREVQARDGAIVARVEWTQPGITAIHEKTHAYISPVFAYEPPAGAADDSSTGKIKQLVRMALTNNPNLSLPAVRNSQQRNDDMIFSAEEIRLIAIHAKKMRPLHEMIKGMQEAAPHLPPHRILDMAKLAVSPETADMDMTDGDDGDGDGFDAESSAADGTGPNDGAKFRKGESLDEMKARHAREMTDAPDGEKAQMAARHNEEMKRFTDPYQAPQSRTMTKAELDGAVAKHPMVIALNRAINGLRGERAAEKAALAVEDAIKAGKLVPAQRDWALAYCTADFAGFKQFIGAQPALAMGEDGTPTGIARIVTQDDPASLTAQELAICSQTRTDPKKFLAQRNENHALMRAKAAPGSLIAIELDNPNRAATTTQTTVK